MLRLQREGFVRFEDFGLDLAWLQTEASAAFAASASTSLVQAKQVRLQSLVSRFVLGLGRLVGCWEDRG